MATDKTATWSFGESVLWYTPNTALDPVWSFGENIILDEYTAGGSILLFVGDTLGGNARSMMG